MSLNLTETFKTIQNTTFIIKSPLSFNVINKQ